MVDDESLRGQRARSRQGPTRLAHSQPIVRARPLPHWPPHGTFVTIGRLNPDGSVAFMQVATFDRAIAALVLLGLLALAGRARGVHVGAMTGGLGVLPEPRPDLVTSAPALTSSLSVGCGIVIWRPANRVTKEPLNSPIGPGRDPDGLWSYCVTCTGLFFSNTSDVGACPAPKTSGHTAGGGYTLTTSRAGETGWRFCTRCRALCYERGLATGANACPANPKGHVVPYAPFALDTSGADSIERQAHWMWCGACGVLFFEPNNPGYCTKRGSSGHVVAPTSASHTLQNGFGPNADVVLLDAFRAAAR